VKIQKLGLLLWPLMLTNRAVTSASAQQTQPQLRYVSDDGGASRSNANPGMDRASPRTTSTEPLNSCADSLSAALQQGTPEFPCWANIRTIERWNTAAIVSGLQPGSDANVELPKYVPSTFNFTMAGLSGFSFPDASPGRAYGGVGAAAGMLSRRRWRIMAEDGGGLADFQLDGDHLVGLNRGALRATGELTSRWTWQGSATNTYGTDAARVVAPLDFRQVGDAEAPAADTVVYGLHPGRITTGEEGGKLRFEDSRRSFWDFSATHDYTQYNADNFLVQTARARVEYLHAVTPAMGFGVYGTGEHQTGPLDCSLGGAGLRWLTELGVHTSLNVSSGLSGASASCGKRAQFTGTAVLYMQLRPSTDLYLTGGRDLSDGVLEQSVFLSTGAAGLRHSFHRMVDTRVSLNGIQGVNPVTKQSYHGTFVDGSLHYRMGLGFSQEFEVRHYDVADTPTNNRTIAVFTLWWTPRRATEVTSARASLR
jgi:hypothetical protein